MLAAAVSRDDSGASSSSFEDRKVRSGSMAFAALSLGDSQTLGADGSPSDSVSIVTMSPTPPTSVPTTKTAPVDISATQSVGSFKAGSSGRLSFLGCFSSGALHTLDDEQQSSSTCECEVGIRPSFYWMDGPASEEQRAEAEGAMRFLKADCQDEAKVIQNFSGIPGLIFVGVFDGHGPHGRSAAKFASDRLPTALAAQTSAMHSRSERKRLKAMREACRVVNAGMNNLKEAQFDSSLSGTTACFALVVAGPRGTRLLLANVGDSRCVLGRSRSDGGVEAVPLTIDAKPSLPAEQKRIIACGGVVRQLLDEQGQRRGAHRVFRRGDDVLPGLAMSRSLGDAYAHSVGVSWEPMLSAHTMGPKDLFLVIGTDGLWDVMSGDDAVDFVDRYRLRRDPGVSCAEALTLEAQERWKAAHDEALVDDISVAILHFAPMPPPEVEPSLPRTLSRAASCNDEANALASAWANECEMNPSTRSPRPLFKYLYRTGAASGSGDFWESLPKEAPGSPNRLAAAADAAVAEVEASKPSTARESPKLETPRPQVPLPTQPRPIASRVANPRPEPPPSPVQIPSSSQHSLDPNGSDVATTEDEPDAVRLSDRSIDYIPEEHAVHGGHSLKSGPHPDMLLRRSSSGITIPLPQHSYSTSRPIPMSQPRSFSSFNMTASAPAGPSVLSGGNGGGGPELLRPIRKAYPSANTMVSVPSWDGAFYSSFMSESSLPVIQGTDTPRSSESENASMRGRRIEGKHEGKVRRGIPCSFSSVGLASTGRPSTDSEALSFGGSRVGSLEESGLLSSGVLGAPVSPMHSSAGRQSSLLADSFGAPPLSPSIRPRGLPRPASHNSLMAAAGSTSYSGPYRTSSGRVNVLRPITDSIPIVGAARNNV